MSSPTLEQLKAINLSRVLNPKSIALIGATTRKGSFGARTIANLSKFTGDSYLVNAKYAQLGSQQCYSSLSSLPEVPDAVIIALPNHLVEPVAIECAQMGVGGIIIYASGYAETGRQENIDSQTRLSILAENTGLRILGPNCMGIVNYSTCAIQSFQQFPATCLYNGRSMGLVSQSGALALSLSQAVERNVSFSHILTFGNGVDVDIADMIRFLVLDKKCHAIACVFEGIARPDRLIKAAELAWMQKKPLIICKLATGEEGARAALSHTGALAGSDQIYRAALEKYGVIFVDNFESLLEAASFFAKAPQPISKGVAIVAASGGAGIMAADKAEIHSVAIPQPALNTQHILKANIPDFGSPKNPCDVTAEVVNNPQSLHACLEAMAKDPAYGAIVVAHTVAGDSFTPRLDLYAEVAEKYKKPVCAVWLSAWQNGPGAREFENNPYVAVFHSMDHCFFILKKWLWRASVQETPPCLSNNKSSDEYLAVHKALAEDVDGRALTERQAKNLLKKYGIRTNHEELVNSIEDALESARSIGFPIALKLESPDILHKTEAKVIQLDIQNEHELELAYSSILENAHKIRPLPRINGVLVQEMIGPGLELIIGAKIDPVFGAFTIVGHGGVLVEIIKDSVIAPAPISIAYAKKMVESLKGSELLKGYRGSPPVDVENLSTVISRISQFISDHKEQLSEVDINPIICNEKGATVVDALIIKK